MNIFDYMKLATGYTFAGICTGVWAVMLVKIWKRFWLFLVCAFRKEEEDE